MTGADAPGSAKAGGNGSADARGDAGVAGPAGESSGQAEEAAAAKPDTVSEDARDAVEAEVGIPREVLNLLDSASDALSKARVAIVLQTAAAKSSCEGPTARPNAWRDRHLTLGAGSIFYKRGSADREAKGEIELEAIRAVAALPLPAGSAWGRRGRGGGPSDSAVHETGAAVLAAWRTTGGGVGCTAEELDLVVARFRPRQLKPHMLWVRVPDKSYFFAMNSEEERRQWVLVLRAVVYMVAQRRHTRA
ncbi:hypothetical protein FNF27_05530 [Cafeteria roenbergensis]|uniref:PH domain-containing protein n=1 Tax=Cafeteria roenbergensis TaxID=33653 RepID=A0A5A8DY94_CAFRO|nr:hypothetical protein FNF31_01480 [Cafeteria roenbergensis]KAA0169537.1 hypothetical protein FNF28_01982 [Cafeteria roenbergensis]KAA0173039.1 hypothetical protein FNF27_05530 [Cafeteria roenbergensis]